MARKINSRLIIKGTLQAETPLHVGGYGYDVNTDLPLARNGKDEFYIPGTSLAGVLRAWCERNFGNDNIDKIFGYQKDDSGHASFVLVEDAKIKNAGNILAEIRDGVKIDRIYGTAADKAKFDRAILPKGTKIELELTVEIANGADEGKTKAIFGHLLAALQNEEIRLGAAKTRGLGRVKLISWKISEEKFDSFDNIVNLFEGSNQKTYEIQDLIDADANTQPKSDQARLEIEIQWSPNLPLMNKAGYEGIGVDMLPVTSGTENGKLSLVLAGSSIKGSLRSHAEKIMRTLLDSEAQDDSSEQTSVRVVRELFGSKKEKDSKNDKLGLGALSVDDCFSIESFDQKKWREVEQASAKDDVSAAHWEITNALNAVHGEIKSQTQIKNPHFHLTHHTAIDRFTGGVAEGALYSVLAPHDIEWSPIRLTLDFGRCQGNERKCLMLLMLVLRDLAKNRLPLGFATNRGMGEVKVESISLHGENLGSIVSDDVSITIENGKFIASEGLKNLGGENWWK
jgi:CRISPR/Cas system CSM-associated protein Csm3 (group 7 of RAMP superfamily)